MPDTRRPELATTSSSTTPRHGRPAHLTRPRPSGTERRHSAPRPCWASRSARSAFGRPVEGPSDHPAPLRTGCAPGRPFRRGTLIAMTTIAILGAGKIGEAMLAGLLAAGRSPDSLMFTERYPDRVAELTARYGVRGVETDEAAEAGRRADRRGQAAGHRAAAGVAGRRRSRPAPWWCRCAPGCRPSLYERHLPAGTPVVRVMPNTPMLVGEAMSAISAGSHAEPRAPAAGARTCCPRSARWCGCRRRSRTR